ncbi:MAG: hypothetical protein HKN23_02230 [Verrucomicrobiales bacterium]|nr:hypothetical protein [Verrucomicrobiales bacterium]
MIEKYLDEILIAAAVGQLLIAALNLRLDKILHWDKDLASLPKLLREVFVVHKWFITITLVIFGAITIRFAGDIATASYEMTRWFAAGVGIFWGIRTLIQWFYYSHDHWTGKPRETAIHWTLTICYGGCALTYLLAAFR